MEARESKTKKFVNCMTNETFLYMSQLWRTINCARSEHERPEIYFLELPVKEIFLGIYGT